MAENQEPITNIMDEHSWRVFFTGDDNSRRYVEWYQLYGYVAENAAIESQ